MTEGAGAQEGPTLEANSAAIEKLMVEFGASRGGEACDFYSVDFLARIGSLERCRRISAGTDSITYTVDDVSIDGDDGSATVTSEGGGRPLIYPITRDGELSDAYDGWTIDGYFEKGQVADGAPSDAEPPATVAQPEGEETAPAEETTTAPDASTDPDPIGDAVAYQSCIEGEGIQDVKNQPFGFGTLPLVSFPAGGAVIDAVFTPSKAQATKGRKAAGGGAIVQLESALLFTKGGSPPEADVGLAYDCVDEVVGG